MRTVRFIPVCLLMIAGAVPAQADLARAPSDSTPAVAPAPEAGREITLPLLSAGSYGSSNLPGLLDRTTSVPYTPGPFDDETAGELRQLPAAPGSVRLALAGFLMVGAVPVLRSARHLHIAALPQWYHTACPDRIGHAVPFDFDLNAMPLCSFAATVGVQNEQPAGFETRCDFSPGWQSQHILPTTAPRGPPAVA